MAREIIWTDAADVTPSDSTNGRFVPTTIFVGVEGDVKVETASGTQVTFKSFSGFLPCLVKRVLATGTTATDIIRGD